MVSGRCGPGEAEQEPECVAVGGDGVAAGVTLAEEPFGEERLEGRAKDGHGRGSKAASRRAAARTSSSGVPVRYQ